MLKRGVSLTEFQQFIKEIDYKPEQKMHYFYKLVEEVGELSEVLRKNKRLDDTGQIKGTIEEELYDILYYVAAIANVHGINLEDCMIQKEEINKIKWNR